MPCTTQDAFWRIFIADSNVAFVLPIYALLSRSIARASARAGQTGTRISIKGCIIVWPEISQIIFCGFFSFIYHLCDDANGQEVCFRYCLLHPKNLHVFDFIFSYQIFAVLAFISDNVNYTFYKCIGMSTYFVINVCYFAFYSYTFPEWLYTLILTIVTIVIILTMRFNKMWFYSILQILPIALLAFTCKLMFYYRLFHGLWHIFIALFIYYYIDRSMEHSYILIV